jgi:hypothetical protein
MKKVLLVLVLVLFAGCAEDGSLLDDSDGGADGGDSDTDTDSDTDSDTDQGGECTSESLEGCDNPPLDTCDDMGRLVQYDGPVACVDGWCTYGFEITPCDYGCVDAGDGEEDYCATDTDTDTCDDDLCMYQCVDNGYDVGVCVDGECQCYNS